MSVAPGAQLGVEQVAVALRALRDEIRDTDTDGGAGGPGVANMRAYLALRRDDHRTLQHALTRLGLASLVRSQAHVLATLEQVLAVAERLADDPAVTAPSLDAAGALLEQRARALFGERRPHRDTSIMVTLPGAAATDPGLARSFAAAGMDCARINSAHDDVAAWRAMASHVRAASAAVGRRTPIVVDLPGPKLRTGPIEAGVEVVHLRPRHDSLGAVVAPGRAWLHAEGSRAVPPDGGAVLPVAAAWLAARTAGERVRFADARGKHRELRIGAGSAEGRWAELHRGAYVVSGTTLRAASGEQTRVGRLPPLRSSIPLAVGDTLVLTRDQAPGRPATPTAPARIACTLAEVFVAARVGDVVSLDDGKFGGTAHRVTPDTIEVEITHAPPGGGRLRAEKGINLPETAIPVAAWRATDDATIAFAVAHADMVGLSFVATRDDVRAVADALARHDGARLGLLLKIETRAAFRALPELLAEALGRDAPCGVMIARGDLAIEVGWERMAEVQEEILWLCEAAHVPVVWATQVLDTLARTGLASRAEITDAASGSRAECVMLNKGPMVVAAIVALDDILARMAIHRHKTTTLLGELRAWDAEPPSSGA